MDAKQKVEPDASLPAIKEEDDEDEVIQVRILRSKIHVNDETGQRKSCVAQWTTSRQREQMTVVSDPASPCLLQVDDSLEEGEVCDKSDEANTQVAESKKVTASCPVLPCRESRLSQVVLVISFTKTRLCNS